jgi:hypothetical protein
VVHRRSQYSNGQSAVQRRLRPLAATERDLPRTQRSCGTTGPRSTLAPFSWQLHAGRAPVPHRARGPAPAVVREMALLIGRRLRAAHDSVTRSVGPVEARLAVTRLRLADREGVRTKDGVELPFHLTRQSLPPTCPALRWRPRSAW